MVVLTLIDRSFVVCSGACCGYSWYGIDGALTGTPAKVLHWFTRQEGSMLASLQSGKELFEASGVQASRSANPLHFVCADWLVSPWLSLTSYVAFPLFLLHRTPLSALFLFCLPAFSLSVFPSPHPLHLSNC